MADNALREAEKEFQRQPSDEGAQRLLAQRARSGLAASKLFIVVKLTYQYNDEIYWNDGGTDDSGSYSISSAFTDRSKAEAVCEQKNLEEFISNCINSDPDSYYKDLGEWLGTGSHTTWLANPDIFRRGLEEKEAKLLWKKLTDACGITLSGIAAQAGQGGNCAEDHGRYFERMFSPAYRTGKISRELLSEVRKALALDFYTVVETTIEDGICGSV